MHNIHNTVLYELVFTLRMPHMLICGYDIGVGWMDQSDFRFSPVDIFTRQIPIFQNKNNTRGAR